jgi:hypothetical protein
MVKSSTNTIKVIAVSLLDPDHWINHLRGVTVSSLLFLIMITINLINVNINLISLDCQGGRDSKNAENCHRKSCSETAFGTPLNCSVKYRV